MRVFALALLLSAVSTLALGSALGLIHWSTPPAGPATLELGQPVLRVGDAIYAVADRVDRVPIPVPVPGTPSCSRPGCR